MTRYLVIRKSESAPRPDDSGMTLLEVMIAAGVMAVAFVFVMGSIISVGNTTDISEDQAVAAATVSSMLEELGAMTFEELIAFQPYESENLGSTTEILVECVDDYGTGYQLPIPEDMAGYMPNPVEVRVTVDWQDEMGRPFSMMSSMYCGR